MKKIKNKRTGKIAELIRESKDGKHFVVRLESGNISKWVVGNCIRVLTGNHKLDFDEELVVKTILKEVNDSIICNEDNIFCDDGNIELHFTKEDVRELDKAIAKVEAGLKGLAPVENLILEKVLKAIDVNTVESVPDDENAGFNCIEPVVTIGEKEMLGYFDQLLKRFFPERVRDEHLSTDRDEKPGNELPTQAPNVLSHFKINNIKEWSNLNKLHPSIEKHLIKSITYTHELPKTAQIRVSPIAGTGKLCAKYWEPKIEQFVFQGCLTQAQYAGIFMQDDQVDIRGPNENKLKELEPLFEMIEDKTSCYERDKSRSVATSKDRLKQISELAWNVHKGLPNPSGKLVQIQRICSELMSRELKDFEVSLKHTATFIVNIKAENAAKAEQKALEMFGSELDEFLHDINRHVESISEF